MISRGPLANQPDVEFAGLAISPSRRHIAGTMGEHSVEPLVMQLLLLLGGSCGAVVDRRTIFAELWGSSQVGDDSLNRVVASLRKALQRAAGDKVAGETIPRVGDRLTD